MNQYTNVLAAVVLIVFVQVFSPGSAAPANSDLYHVGPDGRVVGGINLASSTNHANPNGLSLSTNYATGVNFEARPGQGNEVHKTSTAGASASLNLPVLNQYKGLANLPRGGTGTRV